MQPPKDYAEKHYHRRTNWPASIAAATFVVGCTVWFAYLLVERLAK